MTSPIRFSDDLLRRYPEVYEYVENGWRSKFLQWVIDARYRRAVSLEPWLKEQIEHPSGIVSDFAASIAYGDDPDTCVMNILLAVQGRIRYLSDNLNPFHPNTDYWQKAEETLQINEGDCEDGAVLIYVTARLKGVPASRLLLWAGNVSVPGQADGGHCCCLYIPTHYPLCWTFLDWCYWPTPAPVDGENGRPLYVITHTTPNAWSQSSKLDMPSNYHEMWFSFNEEKSILSFAPTVVPDVPA